MKVNYPSSKFPILAILEVEAILIGLRQAVMNSSQEGDNNDNLIVKHPSTLISEIKLQW